MRRPITCGWRLVSSSRWAFYTDPRSSSFAIANPARSATTAEAARRKRSIQKPEGWAADMSELEIVTAESHRRQQRQAGRSGTEHHGGHIWGV